MNGRPDGRTDGWMDGWMGGWIDGWREKSNSEVRISAPEAIRKEQNHCKNAHLTHRYLELSIVQMPREHSLWDKIIRSSVRTDCTPSSCLVQLSRPHEAKTSGPGSIGFGRPSCMDRSNLSMIGSTLASAATGAAQLLIQHK